MKLKIAIAILFFSALCFAQFGYYFPVTMTIPSVISPLGNSNTTQVIDCSRQKLITMQFRFRFHTASSNGVQVLTFARSLDRTNYIDSLWFTNTLTPNSTNYVTIGLTNVETFGCGYIHLVSWTNFDAVAKVTNLSGIYGLKTGAP